MAEKLLRGELEIFTNAAGTAPPAPNEDPTAATVPWTSVGEKNLLVEDALTLSHSESIEDEMVLNETVAIDDYRVSEEWMLNFQSKDYTAEVLQRAINGNAIETVAPGSGEVGYLRIPLRKGPAVQKLAIMARIDDSPYRVTTVLETTAIRTQITFLNASQRNGFESTLGPKQQGAMINFDFKGLIDDTTDEVGYIDLTNADVA